MEIPASPNKGAPSKIPTFLNGNNLEWKEFPKPMVVNEEWEFLGQPNEELKTWLIGMNGGIWGPF